LLIRIVRSIQTRFRFLTRAKSARATTALGSLPDWSEGPDSPRRVRPQNFIYAKLAIHTNVIEAAQRIVRISDFADAAIFRWRAMYARQVAAYLKGESADVFGNTSLANKPAPSYRFARLSALDGCAETLRRRGLANVGGDDFRRDRHALVFM
jgi:hypothetical protein